MVRYGTGVNRHFPGQRTAGVLPPISLACFFLAEEGPERGRECLGNVRGPREGDEPFGAEYICAVLKALVSTDGAGGGFSSSVFSVLTFSFHVDE